MIERPAAIPSTNAATTPRGPFVSLGEQLRAIVRAGAQTTTTPDPRLYEVRAAAGASEAVPSDGGFLLQPEFSRRIIERMYQTGDIFQRCMEVPVGVNGLTFPQFDETSRVTGSRLGGIQVYLENEAGNMLPTSLQAGHTSQKPTFNLSTLTTNKITGLLYLSDELATDSAAFETWATYAFSQELMFTLENLIVNGTGAGQPMGVMNSPALATVAPQSGQASKTVVSQNINTMLAAFWARSYNSDGAVFLYNQALLPQLSSLSTLVGTAGSESKLWQWATAADDYDRLAGFPAIMCEYAQIPGTPGDIILADFSRYIIAMRERQRAQMSIHVKFLTDEQAFRFVMRVTGQPIDRTPVMPLNGNVATSPFVAIQAR